MKKNIVYLSIIFSIFMFLNVDVYAYTYQTKDIPNNSYVIGTHLFTREPPDNVEYDGTLKTKYIMLGASTIKSESENDMIIYYKNPRGKWINEMTEEEVQIGETIEIEYKDTVKYLLKPRLTSVYNKFENGYYKYEFQIENSNEFSSDDSELSNYKFEVYDKETNEVVSTGIIGGVIGNVQLVSVEVGEKKTFVARVYTEDDNGNKNYSEYSDEYEVDKSNLNKPITIANYITINSSYYTEGYNSYEINIRNFLDYCGGNDVENFKLEVYQVDDNEYTKLGETIIGGVIGAPVIVKIENGETKKIATKVYTTNANGEKVYSDYSDILPLYENNLVIKFDSNGGSQVENQIVLSGHKVVEPPVPIKQGFKFKEWQLNGSKFDFNTEVTKNITLTAEWTPNNYVIRKTKVDEYNEIDYKLIVLEEDQEIEFKEIKDNDVILCNSQIPVVNINELNGITNLTIVLNDGREVTGVLEN